MTLLPRRRRRSIAAKAYARAKPPTADTPWREACYAVVDLELTGLDPRRDEIISFASVPVMEGRVVAREARALTIRPQQMPQPETIRIHGLRPVDLAEAPALAEVLDSILEALTGSVLVAHVAWVEREFLDAAFKDMGVRVSEPVLDTAVLAHHVLSRPGDFVPERVALSVAARKLGMPVHRPHVAEGDALTTAQLFLALASHLQRSAPQTVGSLARLSTGKG